MCGIRDSFHAWSDSCMTQMTQLGKVFHESYSTKKSYQGRERQLIRNIGKNFFLCPTIRIVSSMAITRRLKLGIGSLTFEALHRAPYVDSPD
jgi:hypothetical protein